MLRFLANDSLVAFEVLSVLVAELALSSRADMCIFCWGA